MARGIWIAVITIYQKPTCTTCKQVYSALRDAGVDFNALADVVVESAARVADLTGAELDRAVASAYGWTDWGQDGLTDDEILERLFKLNQQRAAKQGA